MAAMNAALACQQRGEFGAADRLYSAALALDPENFDALHMQGVVAYQRREFHRAEALIRHAIEISPQIETARHNLNLVLLAHALESELCQAMLPPLAACCEISAPPGGSDTHLITCEGADNEALRAYRAAIEAALVGDGASLWRQQHDGTLLPARDHVPETPPRAGTFVFVGTRTAPGPWYRGATPSAAVIVCHEAASCELYDQIRAVSHELAHKVHLWFASAAVAQEAGLPGRHGDAAALAVWLHPERARPS
jgi:hypothetical protein